MAQHVQWVANGIEHNVLFNIKKDSVPLSNCNIMSIRPYRKPNILGGDRSPGVPHARDSWSCSW